MIDATLMRKAREYDVPYQALLEVYRRGIGAHKTNPQSVRMKGTGEKGVNAPMSMKLGPQQWAMGRVNAFLEKRPTVYTGADNDIRLKYRVSL